MSRSFRRYQVHLPQSYNDNTPVPDDLIGDTLIELRRQFGAASCETQPIQGQWEHGGKVYCDELIRVFVDVPDTEEHRHFFEQFKERLKVRFQQIDIWISTFLIEVI